MANIKGVAKWAKLGIPKDNYDEYQGNGKRNYMIDLYVSDDDLVKFKGDIDAAYGSIGKPYVSCKAEFKAAGKARQDWAERTQQPWVKSKDGKQKVNS